MPDELKLKVKHIHTSLYDELKVNVTAPSDLRKWFDVNHAPPLYIEGATEAEPNTIQFTCCHLYNGCGNFHRNARFSVNNTHDCSALENILKNNQVYIKLYPHGGDYRINSFRLYGPEWRWKRLWNYIARIVRLPTFNDPLYEIQSFWNKVKK